MLTDELICALRALKGRRIQIAYDTCAPTPHTTSTMIASKYGGLVDVKKTFIQLQLRERRGTAEMFIPIELIKYFVDISDIAELEQAGEQ